MASAKRRAIPPDPIETQRAIFKAIAAAQEPFSVEAVVALVDLPRKVPKTQVSKLLAEEMKSARLFAGKADGKKAFWHHDPKAIATSAILEVAAAEVLTAEALAQKAALLCPRITLNFKTLQKTLLDNGQLLKVKAAPGTKATAQRLINAERPEVYIESEIALLLKEVGLTRLPERIQALPEAESPGEEELVRDAAEKIFAAMNRIAFAPGTTVTFCRLRQQPELSNMPKPVFDRAALLLQKERRALLSIHDHAARLPAEEREGLVTDGFGKYYVSIYAR